MTHFQIFITKSHIIVQQYNYCENHHQCIKTVFYSYSYLEQISITCQLRFNSTSNVTKNTACCDFRVVKRHIEIGLV